MTTLNEARQLLYRNAVDTWPFPTPPAHVGDLQVPYQLDGEAGFKQPASGPWSRISLRHETSQQNTLGAAGGRKYQRTARLYVQIFTELAMATKQADTIGAAIRQIFEGKRISGVIVGAGNPRELGPTDKWNNLTVDFPVTYFETL